MAENIIINGVDVSGCAYITYQDSENPICSETGQYCKGYDICYYKQLKRKEQEYEELRQYHNKCCEEFEKEKQNLIDRYNQFSKDFFIGKYCKKEYCDLLKAKVQECEELKKNVEHWKMEHKEAKAKGEWTYDLVKKRLEQQLDKLKAENEKYSFFIEKLCDYIGLECDSEDQAMRTLSDFARQMNKLRWIIDRYKQTLTEIKEIAEKAKKDICNNCGWRNTDSCDPEDYTCGEFIKILQKISEAENE